MTQLPLNCEPDRKAVREQLDRILKSGPFLQARRRQRFLEYIVNETLAGRGERLKGYDIALEVFGRPDTFDPVVDPIVRVEAGRLREKLRDYYEADGQNDPIRIALPKGTYTPLIEFRQGPTLAPQLDATTPDQQLDPMSAPVAPTDTRPPSARPWSDRFTRWQSAAPAFALILILAAVGAWLYRDLRGATPEATGKDPALTVLNDPAVAVLPFINLSGDPKQDYFSDGLTEDILTALSRARDLRVLARNTTFQYKGLAVDVSKLGRELRVRYVLEGSIQRSGDRLRVTAQLIDTETGSHIWADQFDREMADIFLVQDEIVSQIVTKIAGGYGVIEATEFNTAVRKSPDQVQAYDLVLRAHYLMTDVNRENFGLAKDALRQAIVLDPLNARAHREETWQNAMGAVMHLEKPPVPLHEIAVQAAKAVQLNPADARAHMVAAFAYFFDKQHDLFEHEAEQAMALAPYDAEILATLGDLIASSGDWQRGVALVTKANALNADAASGWYQFTMYKDYYVKGDYERALEILRQDPEKGSIFKYIYYIAVYGQLGRKQDALENWRKLRTDERDWTAASFENWYRMWNMRDQDIAKMMDGVYKSGVLEVDAKSGQ